MIIRAVEGEKNRVKHEGFVTREGAKKNKSIEDD
jgi:hypothetical protein